jgi:hypothetical protein
MKLDIKHFNPCADGLAYYESQASSKEAWSRCEHGDWMLWIAMALKVDDRILVRAKALCANTVRHLMTDERSPNAIDAALRYAGGRISREELDKFAASAASAATYVVYHSTPAAGAASCAAASAARAVFSDPADSVAKHSADSAAYFASSSTFRTINLRQTADICREILTDAVMEKVKQFNHN